MTLPGIASRVVTLETFGLSSSPAARGSIPEIDIALRAMTLPGIEPGFHA